MTYLNNLFQNSPSAWCISNILIANGAGIFKQSMGAKNRVGIELFFRPARLHRLTESRSLESIPGLFTSLKIPPLRAFQKF